MNHEGHGNTHKRTLAEQYADPDTTEQERLEIIKHLLELGRIATSRIDPYEVAKKEVKSYDSLLIGYPVERLFEGR